MSKFADIYGHEQIKEHLQNAIRLNKVSHAYILTDRWVREKDDGGHFCRNTAM